MEEQVVILDDESTGTRYVFWYAMPSNTMGWWKLYAAGQLADEGTAYTTTEQAMDDFAMDRLFQAAGV